MKQYQYKPLRFYLTCFALTWAFWITAAMIGRSANDNGLSTVLMLFGLISPAVTAVITVLTSGSKALKADLKRKLVGFYRIKPLNILAAILVFMLLVIASILLSIVIAGQSLNQFAFTEDFSFSINGTSALLTILLAAVIEEVGWRGYGEDSVASYFSWFTESTIFGYVKLSDQRRSSRLSDDLGICQKQPQYAGLYYLPSVRKHDAGKDSHDSADKVRGNPYRNCRSDSNCTDEQRNVF